MPLVGTRDRAAPSLLQG